MIGRLLTLPRGEKSALRGYVRITEVLGLALITCVSKSWYYRKERMMRRIHLLCMDAQGKKK